ncbi:MAG: FOG: Ankyrin repeat [uncultured Paraburkholderia sp.]|nr:MAG: FOG: Ankyrin repeat [uncultured Paraburkholderia sp.]CAH2778451.1 MAG: FOG: Ankyrin repeat [uncultured Paraburkholderia sp.]CAH2913020.1 MAG: FOG: Ankyrin repeat [uncultured Paraburkholderia sp.]
MTNSADSSPPSGQAIDPQLLELAQQVFDLARRGDAAMLAAVIEKGVPPNLRNNNGQTPIAGEAFKGFEGVVETLIAHGAKPDARDAAGASALDAAGRMGAAEAQAKLRNA